MTTTMQPVEDTQRVVAPARQVSKKDKKRAAPAPAPASSERVGTASAYPQLVLAGVAVATTSLVYLRYFAGPEFLIATLAAAALGAIIGGIAGFRRWSAAVTVGLAVLGFAVIGVFAVYRATLRHGIPSWDTLRGLGTGLVSGWSRMLSISLPADATGELVITPALLTFVAALVSTTLVLRTKSPLAPVLPTLLAFVAGLPLTAARPVGGMVLVAVLALEMLVLSLVRASAADPLTRSARTRTALSKLAFGLPVVLVVAAAGVAGMRLMPLATGGDRFDLREVVPIQLDINDNISPLVTLKSQLRAPSRDMFTVRLSGDSDGIDRIRTVALDDFDGALWSSRDRFLLAGHRLATSDNLVDPRQAKLHVEIRDLPGPYLPETGAPVEVNAPRVGFAESSGTLATDAPTLNGLSYDLVAAVGRREDLADAVPASTGDTSRYTSLPPGLPAEVAAKAAQLVAPFTEPYAKLLALQKHLQTLPYSLDSRPGHSYDALRRLFGSNPADQVGYAEQFAAAFAVLARSQGFPARVAVGYLLNPKNRKDDTYPVTSADAHAWAEVNLAGYGWVAFEPTDPQRHTAATPKPPETPEAREQNSKPDDNIKASQPTEDPTLPRLTSSTLSVMDWALIVLIGLGVLVVLIPVAVAGEKIRRRTRRRTGSRLAKIVGAWQQTVDRLIQSGIPVTANLTASEVAQQAEDRFGDGVGAVAVLAPLVTKTIFSQDEPDDAAVREAWGLDARLRRELRRARNPLATARGWLDPRPLFARGRDERRRRRELEKLTRG